MTKIIPIISSFPRTSKVPVPMSSKYVLSLNDIVMTVEPTDIYFGDVRFEINELGQKILDVSDLDDLTPGQHDLPAGIECNVQSCDMSLPMIPVDFFYDGHFYNDVWLKAEHLAYVAGNFSGFPINSLMQDLEDLNYTL